MSYLTRKFLALQGYEAEGVGLRVPWLRKAGSTIQLIETCFFVTLTHCDSLRARDKQAYKQRNGNFTIQGWLQRVPAIPAARLSLAHSEDANVMVNLTGLHV